MASLLDLSSKRRKRIKANEENTYGYSYGSFPSSWRYDFEQKRNHNHTQVLNNSEPFTTNDLLYQLDSGKFGSVTKEIEELIKRRRQLLDSFYALNPELPTACPDVQNSVALKSMEVAPPDIIDLDDDNNGEMERIVPEAQLSHHAAPVVIIDSDDDNDAKSDILGVDLKPPFNLLIHDKPSGDLLIKDKPSGDHLSKDKLYGDLLAKDKPYGDLLIKDKHSGNLLMKDFLVMNFSYLCLKPYQLTYLV